MGVNRNTGAYHAERMDSVRGAPQIGGGWELGKKAQRVSDGGTVPDTNGGTSPCGTVSKLSGDQMAQLRNGGVWREECDGSIDAEILATPAIETPQWPFLHTPGDAAAPGCVKIILVVTWWVYGMVLHASDSRVFCKISLERTSTGNHVILTSLTAKYHSSLNRLLIPSPRYRRTGLVRPSLENHHLLPPQI